MDELKHEFDKIIVEINNLETHLKRETYPINNIKEHLIDIKNRINNINERIEDNPAHEEVSKKLIDYSDKITQVLNSGEVFKIREKAIIVINWILKEITTIKEEKSEDREIFFLVKTWKQYITFLDFVKFKIIGKDTFLEKEFLEYMELNKKLFFDIPKNEDVKVYYAYAIITTVRKLSLSKEHHDKIPILLEIENIMKDMNSELIDKTKKIISINKKNYDEELSNLEMKTKELKMVLSGFNISKDYSKGLIGLLLAIELTKFKNKKSLRDNSLV